MINTNKKFLVKLMVFFSLITILLLTNVTKVSASSVKIDLNKTELSQGDILEIKISDWNKKEYNPEDYKAVFADNEIPFYKSGSNSLITNVGISYWTVPGEQRLLLKVDDTIIFGTDIKIKEGDFPESHLEVDKENESKIRPEEKEEEKKIKKEQEEINKARKNNKTKENFVEGSFIWPVSGEISTEFGATRYVNGELNNRHSGIDIAAEKGTSIKAANNGIVTLAGNYVVTGKTIIIDHGRGLFSSYGHLEEIEVKEGQKLNKGDIIGEVGSTGFSTGPHLHWSVILNGVFVNPHNLLD